MLPKQVKPPNGLQATIWPCKVSCRKLKHCIHVQIEQCVEEARKAVASGPCPWTCVVVRGFDGAPISWAGAEHSTSACGGGENDWALLVLPRNHYIRFVLSGRLDVFGSA